MYLASTFKKLLCKNPAYPVDYEPEVTLFISAYNEKEYIEIKVSNSLQLDYPREKLKIIFVTDGSDDGTPDVVKKYPEVRLLHENERKGKIGAINRGIKHVDSPIVIFSDCNTMLAKESVREIVKQFRNPKVGCVAGEKRITKKFKDIAVNAGEGIYWRYESWVKKTESDVYTTIGAAGELFAIRRELFIEVEKDTILDDFIISLRIAQKGYKINYTPKAYAIETASASIREEMKRKVRISSGGLQSLVRLKAILNPFRYGCLTFQYISHKVLRWTIIPFSFPILLVLNLLLFLHTDYVIYEFMMAGQIAFYLFVLIGWALENQHIRIKILFIPYYVFFMNLSVYIGLFRFISGKQSANWDRAKRGE
jgi:cellulose synthase/poly-beta-1,6-N-acetylglucosamine synthase-like glycosyltransferase